MNKAHYMPAPPKLTRAIQYGLILLVAVMPFHAFLSVWLGHLTGHQSVIQAWKEVLLLGLTTLGIALLVRSAETRDRLRTWPVLFGGAFAGVAVLISLFMHPSFTTVLFGAKTDLEFLFAFVLAILVATPRFIERLTITILASACLVVGFNMLQVTILPPDFLTHFGYGSATIVPYQTIDPAIRSLRFAATLGGPNQLGTYLILPLTLTLALAFRRRQWAWLALSAGSAIGIFHTYSRGAWIGAVVAIAITTFILTPSRARLGLLAGFGVLGATTVAAGSYFLKLGGTLQYYLLHSNTELHGVRGSDHDHLTSLQDGINYTLTTPLGHGLGTAGPTAFHTGAGPVIEDNYLQVSYEAGLLGVVLFGALIASTVAELARKVSHNELAPTALASIIGISLTALVLPAWTDSTTVLVVWTAAGSVIGASSTPGRRHV